MPNLDKGYRDTYAVEDRQSYINKKRNAFKGIDKTNMRIYNSRQWRKVRQLVLHNTPYCVHCEQKGIYKTANTIDHIIPLNKGERCLGIFYMGQHDENINHRIPGPIEDKVLWFE